MAAKKNTWKHFISEASDTFSQACPNDPVHAALAFQVLQTEVAAKDLSLQEAYGLLSNQKLINEIIRRTEHATSQTFQKAALNLLAKLVDLANPTKALLTSLGTNAVVGAMFFGLGLYVSPPPSNTPKDGVTCTAPEAPGKNAPLEPQVPAPITSPPPNAERRSKEQVPYSDAPPFTPDLEKLDDPMSSFRSIGLSLLSVGQFDVICSVPTSLASARPTIGQPQISAQHEKAKTKTSSHRLGHGRHTQPLDHFNAAP